jgi:Zn-dependent oligopeptidase
MPASCPASPGATAKRKARDLPIPWRREAEKLLATVPESARQGIRLRAEKKARRAAAAAVTAAHVAAFLGAQAAPPMRWAAAALARLAKVPEPVRDDARARIEAVVRGRGDTEVTLETAEAGFAEARQAMHEAMRAGGHKRTADQVD